MKETSLVPESLSSHHESLKDDSAYNSLATLPSVEFTGANPYSDALRSSTPRSKDVVKVSVLDEDHLFAGLHSAAQLAKIQEELGFTEGSGAPSVTSKSSSVKDSSEIQSDHLAGLLQTEVNDILQAQVKENSAAKANEEDVSTNTSAKSDEDAPHTINKFPPTAQDEPLLRLNIPDHSKQLDVTILDQPTSTELDYDKPCAGIESSLENGTRSKETSREGSNTLEDSSLDECGKDGPSNNSKQQSWEEDSPFSAPSVCDLSKQPDVSVDNSPLSEGEYGQPTAEGPSTVINYKEISKSTSSSIPDKCNLSVVENEAHPEPMFTQQVQVQKNCVPINKEPKKETNLDVKHSDEAIFTLGSRYQSLPDVGLCTPNESTGVWEDTAASGSTLSPLDSPKQNVGVFNASPAVLKQQSTKPSYTLDMEPSRPEEKEPVLIGLALAPKHQDDQLPRTQENATSSSRSSVVSGLSSTKPSNTITSTSETSGVATGLTVPSSQHDFQPPQVQEDTTTSSGSSVGIFKGQTSAESSSVSPSTPETTLQDKPVHPGLASTPNDQLQPTQPQEDANLFSGSSVEILGRQTSAEPSSISPFNTLQNKPVHPGLASVPRDPLQLTQPQEDASSSLGLSVGIFSGHSAEPSSISPSTTETTPQDKAVHPGLASTPRDCLQSSQPQDDATLSSGSSVGILGRQTSAEPSSISPSTPETTPHDKPLHPGLASTLNDHLQPTQPQEDATLSSGSSVDVLSRQSSTAPSSTIPPVNEPEFTGLASSLCQNLLQLPQPQDQAVAGSNSSGSSIAVLSRQSSVNSPNVNNNAAAFGSFLNGDGGVTGFELEVSEEN